MPRQSAGAVVFCFSLAFLAVLCGCGGGGTSSGLPSSSVQLSVQTAGGGAGAISSNPAGINCGRACSASFSSGTQVTLTATPTANSFFAGWSGACSGTDACRLTLTQNSSVMATFSASPVLTVALGGTGSGSVTSNPSGINCGSTCSASFGAGTPVTLTATAAANSTFAGWTGGGCGSSQTCVVTLNASEKVTATFNTLQSGTVLSVIRSGTGSGTVTSNPAGINCGTTCSASFAAGTQVTLTATAGTNSYFAGWSGGGCSGSNPTCTVTLNTSQQVTATFNVIQSTVTLSVTLTGTGSGTVTSIPQGINCGTTCNANFAGGTQVTLTATPVDGSNFIGWGGACSGVGSTCTLTLDANQQVTATFNPQNLTAINHIIFLAQENRSFDHYFGMLRAYWAANGVPDQSLDGLPQFNPTSGIPPLYGPPPTNPGCDPSVPPPACKYDSNSPQVPSYQLITQCIENPGDEWSQSHIDYNLVDPISATPTMDGFVWTAAFIARHRKPQFNDLDGIRAMGYNDSTELNYYYYMATAFATSDRWFSPVMTRTQPNRQYLAAATSQGYVHPNPPNKPPLSAMPIFEELENAGISWKIYVNPGHVCTGPPYDPHCLLSLSTIQDFLWGQLIPTHYPNNLAPISEYFSDVQNGTLPQVALIEPASDLGLDEHPSDNVPSNIQLGAQYVSTLINGLMDSPSWKDSVFILTYDEFGGMYDHVPPQPTVNPDGIKPLDLRPNDVCYPPKTGPTCDFTYTGFRLPLIVVSPYTKQNYVSHTVADTTAILKLIETRFNVPPLTKRDAAQMDMTEFFDFTNPPWMAPPEPPVQATNGSCYVNKLP